MVIFVDTNVFVRALIQPSTSEYARMTEQARELFQRAASGEIELTTSEAHIAETIFILTSKRHYGVDADRCAGMLAVLLGDRSMKFANKKIVLEALELWAKRPSLGFHDAVAVVHSRQPDVQLATFDYALRGIDGVNAWSPGILED